MLCCCELWRQSDVDTNFLESLKLYDEVSDRYSECGQYLHYVVTLVRVCGVLVQLSNLPVQVGVPGPQLEAVKWLDMEVRPFDLQIRETEISFSVGR